MGIMNGTGPASAHTEVEARGIVVSTGKPDAQFSKPTPNQTQARSTQEWRLYYGRRPMLAVVLDWQYPAMWRVRLPDGRLTDMMNLTRAKDAASSIAMRDLAPSHKPELLHWKGGETTPAAPPMRQIEWEAVS